MVIASISLPSTITAQGRLVATMTVYSGHESYSGAGYSILTIPPCIHFNYKREFPDEAETPVISPEEARILLMEKCAEVAKKSIEDAINGLNMVNSTLMRLDFNDFTKEY